MQVAGPEVEASDLEPPPQDLTDRLHVLRHAGAIDTTEVATLVVDGRDPVGGLVAGAAALVAVNLQSPMNRGSAKEATDPLDIVRLVIEPATTTSGFARRLSAGAQMTLDEF